jgi:hypothetical protein
MLPEYTPDGKLPDYLRRDDLRLLDLRESEISRMLASSPITGHDGQPVIEAERVREWLVLFERERSGQ